MIGVRMGFESGRSRRERMVLVQGPRRGWRWAGARTSGCRCGVALRGLWLAGLVVVGWALVVSAAPVQLFGTDRVAEICDRVRPSVVAIESVQFVRARRYRGFGDPFFDQLFRGFFDEGFDGYSNNVIPQRGNGSGVIIDARGFILTNHHVVDGADEIRVTLREGVVVKGRIVGQDPQSDLAVIKVETTESLPAVTIGDSDRLRVGEWVIAIGNPFGLGITVTVGVVSALQRNLSIDRNRTLRNFIQTDASINPGNSGGPLINSAGELVGINTAIIQNAQGIGFAIPVSSARRIIQDLITHGSVRKTWIGLALQALTRDLADHLGVPAEGVLVTQVEPGSPAEQAGLQPGDALVSVDARRVKTVGEVQDRLERLAIGESAKLGVLRKGQQVELTLTVGSAREPSVAENLLGVKVVPVSPSLRRQHDLAVERGLMITAVGPQTVGAMLGLRPRDVVIAINSVRVADEKSLAQALDQARRRGRIALTLARGALTQTIILDLQ